MNNELGMQLQAYIEGCQMQYTAPRGRVLLYMVSQRFFLDQRRGANLTEQALLELQLDTFTYQSFLAFANRAEYILNSIPFEHQPSEQTKFTWLFSRLKKVVCYRGTSTASKMLERVRTSGHGFGCSRS